MDERRYDVVVVGGGPAGLAGAVALGRSLRTVLVADGGQPRNAVSPGAHNVLGHEGIAPQQLLKAGRQEAASYGVELHDGEVLGARRDAGTFVLDLGDGVPVRARRLLLATGLVDELPEIPGIGQAWGRTVLHCPYCHGWEVRGQRIGVLGTGPRAVHQTLLFRQLSPDVTLFRHTMPELSDEEWEQLAALGVQVVDGTVERVRTEGDQVRAAVLAGGREVPVDALAVAPGFTARAGLYEQLGGVVATHEAGGTYVRTEAAGRTEVPGVWAAGNVADPGAVVVAATAAGLWAGGAINADLVLEDARTAVATRAAR